MATLQTNLSSSPYFDTFKETGNYYRVLYKPSVAVQVRELNEVQSIFQDQINKLGRSVFKEGSIIEGCTFSFDYNRPYVKVSDNYSNGTAFTITDFQDKFVLNRNGLKAKIVATRTGFSSQDPDTNTLYLKYRNSAIYANGIPQTTFDSGEDLSIVTSANVLIGNISVLTVTNAIGVSYAARVTDGVIFKKGLMLNVKGQSVTVLPYANNPDNLSVGFEAVESIETASSNSSLYDNAAGSPNYLAPGADRLRIDPTLVVRTTDSVTNTSTFFSLVDFKGGNPVTIKQDPQVEILTDEIARRTFETSGDFVVAPFIMTTENLANTSDPQYATKLNLVVSRGLGYVKGYRIEYLNNNVAKFRKSTDYKSTSGQIVTANYGNYFYVNEVSGQFFSNSSIISVDLYNAPLTSVSSGALLSVSPSATNKIGTGYIRGFSYVDGTMGTKDARYALYLFNYADNMTGGFSPSDIRSIVYNNGGIKGVADVVTQKQGTLATNTAVLQQSNINVMMFNFGQKAIKADGFNNTSFVYRNKVSSSVLTNGNAAITIPAAGGTGTESLPYGAGQLTQALQEEFHIVATSSSYTANLTGNVAVSSSSNAVTGAYGTTFLTSFYPGDYIYVQGDSRLITGITNNSYLNVLSPFSASNANSRYAKSFPAGAVVPISDRPNRYIYINSSSAATIVLGETLNSSFNIDVTYNTSRAATVPIKKIVNQDVYVKIRPSNSAAGLSGPWSLGLPDVYQISSVYISNDGSTYSSSGTDYKQWFTLDTGQRDTFYGLAKLQQSSPSIPGIQINANTRITVKLSHFTYDQSSGRGFFTANSYPIDDANTSNTTAITTAEIPVFSSSSGKSYDLRSVVDFRPFATNTATSTTTLASATINPSSTVAFSGSPYLPAPDSDFQTDLQYYLRRIDRVAIDTTGNIVITEGVPVAANPGAPVEQSGTMTLGLVFVPPYPTLSSVEGKTYNRPEYTVSTQPIQNRRYTMKNIGEIDKRIQNIEYYTSLNLLEQAASTLLVRSTSTGQNRFQNGIFADPFRDHSYGNLVDPQYYIGIDSQATELRPAHAQFRSTLEYSPALSTNVRKRGGLVLLEHTTNNSFITQGFASKYRNCVEGNIFHYNGTVVLSPFGTVTPDINAPVTVLNNTLDLTQNWQTLDKAWGTQWGNWTEIPDTEKATKLLVAGSKKETGNFDSDSGLEDKTTTQTLETISKQYQQAGTQLNSSVIDKSTFNLGTYVTDVSIQPWLKSSVIKLYIRGMKPKTRLYVYLDNKPMAVNIAPYANASFIKDANYTSTSSSSGFNGDALYSDSYGRAWATMYIPAHDPDVPNSGFQARELPVLITDVSDLAQGLDASTTSATAVFVGSGLTVQKGQSILSVKDVDLSYDTVVSKPKTVDYLGYTQTVTITDHPTSSSCGCGGCFTYDTIVEMADGSTKKIIDVKIGDRVYNRDKTSINTVKFIEKTVDNRFEKLYSPTRALKPFATVNHPIYIDGVLSSVDPEMNYNFYPWLGRNNKIENAVLEDASGDMVYNLWVDGDGTYTVNGYGTTSIIGDGAAVRQAVEYGYFTEEEAVNIVLGYSESGPATSYGSYIIINALAMLDFKPLTWLAAKAVKREGSGKKIIDTIFNVTGSIALLFNRQ
jgi:hypothetical protein